MSNLRSSSFQLEQVLNTNDYSMKHSRMKSMKFDSSSLSKSGLIEQQDIQWKDESTSSWVTIKKNKNVEMKLNFVMDRACKVKQDLRAKRNVLMSELRTVPGLIVDEMIKYYYEPYQHDLTTEQEDFDLYEKMKFLQMDEKHRTHYKNVVNELVDTEKTYIQCLDIIIVVYLDTLIKCCSSKKKEELKPIEEQIKKMKTSHEALLNSLNQAVVSNPECPLIGDIIERFSPELETGADYIFNYPKYLEIITSIMDGSARSAAAKAAEGYKKTHGDCHVQSVQQYLITPIQRIPRYVMLITDLLRNISMSFGDAPRLVEAHKTIKKVATKIDSKGREYEAHENMCFVKSIMDGFCPKEKPEREFVCCGPLYVVNDRVTLPSVWKYCFLFTDFLVITEVDHFKGKSVKERTETLYESMIRIPELKELHDSKFHVETIIRFYEDTVVEIEEDTKFVHNMFTIKETSSDLLSENITLASTTSDCSVAWFTAIKSVLKNYVQK